MDANPSFQVVEAFERRMAAFSGSKHAVAVATGTWAIFLSCVYCKVGRVILPARTFVSVPMAVLHAGGSVQFEDFPWQGVYAIGSIGHYPIWDGALRFRAGMYERGLHCLSFHARKSLPIGEGGMILTDDAEAAEWLRAARYSGRREKDGFDVRKINMLGWNCYMTPEKAARGLHLMEYATDEPDQVIEYPDLREVPIFRTT